MPHGPLVMCRCQHRTKAASRWPRVSMGTPTPFPPPGCPMDNIVTRKGAGRGQWPLPLAIGKTFKLLPSFLLSLPLGPEVHHSHVGRQGRIKDRALVAVRLGHPQVEEAQGWFGRGSGPPACLSGAGPGVNVSSFMLCKSFVSLLNVSAFSPASLPVCKAPCLFSPLEPPFPSNVDGGVFLSPGPTGCKPSWCVVWPCR